MDNFKSYVLVRIYESKEGSNNCYLDFDNIKHFDNTAEGALEAIKYCDALVKEKKKNKNKSIIDLTLGTLSVDMTIKKWVVENGKVKIS